MLAALASLINEEERIVCIEDTRELQIPIPQLPAARGQGRPREGRSQRHHPGSGTTCPASPPRPPHRRRGPRRRGRRSHPGPQHRPRRLHLHRPRQLRPRRPHPPGYLRPAIRRLVSLERHLRARRSCRPARHPSRKKPGWTPLRSAGPTGAWIQPGPRRLRLFPRLGRIPPARQCRGCGRQGKGHGRRAGFAALRSLLGTLAARQTRASSKALQELPEKRAEPTSIRTPCYPGRVMSRGIHTARAFCAESKPEVLRVQPIPANVSTVL